MQTDEEILEVTFEFPKRNTFNRYDKVEKPLSNGQKRACARLKGELEQIALLKELLLLDKESQQGEIELIKEKLKVYLVEKKYSQVKLQNEASELEKKSPQTLQEEDRLLTIELLNFINKQVNEINFTNEIVGENPVNSNENHPEDSLPFEEDIEPTQFSKQEKPQISAVFWLKVIGGITLGVGLLALLTVGLATGIIIPAVLAATLPIITIKAAATTLMTLLGGEITTTVAGCISIATGITFFAVGSAKNSDKSIYYVEEDSEEENTEEYEFLKK